MQLLYLFISHNSYACHSTPIVSPIMQLIYLLLPQCANIQSPIAQFLCFLSCNSYTSSQVTNHSTPIPLLLTHNRICPQCHHQICIIIVLFSQVWWRAVMKLVACFCTTWHRWSRMFCWMTSLRINLCNHPRSALEKVICKSGPSFTKDLALW